MLQYLKITNLALLDEVTLEFESGFTAVTGETGAGKSVLLGALGLLAGARSDKTLIRQGTNNLRVEAALYFEDASEVDVLLEQMSLPPCEEGVLLLQRSIDRKKMPRILINGALATLTQLQGLGESWIDFHGPGEPQKLFRERRQLEMLDLYAENSIILRAYAAVYESWKRALDEVELLETSERLDEDEIDFLRKQLSRIHAVGVSEAGIEELEQDFQRMMSAQDLTQLVAQCSDGLIGDAGISAQLSGVVGSLASLVDLDSSSAVFLERAQSILLELQDLGDEMTKLASDYDFDTDAVEVTSERMALWQEVRRKFGGSVKAVLAKRDEIAQKLSVQGDIEGILSEKRSAILKLEKELSARCVALRERRETASKLLGEKTASLLKALGFKKARLVIEVVPEDTFREYGDTRCRFLFAPNAGQELLPLNKIASSGETARVMLALKTVLAEIDATPLLVFDEVDANVGGEVGRAVGAELSRLAGGHQVLCVTHLPQVAALASNHFLVTKLQDDQSTSVFIGSIHEDRDARLQELARMLGDRNSASAKAHAIELLGE